MKKMREIYRRGLIDSLKFGEKGQNKGLSVSKITSMPANLDRNLFVEAALGSSFALHHDLRTAETILISTDAKMQNRLETALPGIEFSILQNPPSEDEESLVLVVFDTNEEGNAIENLYRVLSGVGRRVTVSFTPAEKDRLIRAKKRTEEFLSVQETSLTKSFSDRGNVASESSTRHMDLYYESEEKNFLIRALETINRALLTNSNAYKIAITIDANDDQAYAYIKSRLLVLDEKRINAKGLEDLYRQIENEDALFFDAATASRFLCFSSRIKQITTVSGHMGVSEGDVEIGDYLEGSVKQTNRSIKVMRDSFNLGTLISGVPGTGKTFAAMHLVGEMWNAGRIPAIIISPTEEWNAFGLQNGFRVLSLYGSGDSINFFKCDSGINIERFYENLAMLIASASDAGPYTKPLEKCLLAAFKKVYAGTRSPNPLEVYGEIEEKIIERHGKKTHAGVKYTKHGENIRASLENLRQMLGRQEFSSQEGVDFAALLRQGAIFDLSRVSNRLKPFFYALILNQAYSIADAYDTDGDRELRMLICLEEAQLALGSEERSAAMLDLGQRVKDFRKKGIGLMLVTHSVTDIDPGIRRLCQTKLYFRQSADVTKYAVADLLFDEEEKEALVERLKTLEQRVCALNFVQKEKEDTQVGSGFVKIPVYSDHSSPKLG